MSTTNTSSPNDLYPHLRRFTMAEPVSTSEAYIAGIEDCFRALRRIGVDEITLEELADKLGIFDKTGLFPQEGATK